MHGVSVHTVALAVVVVVRRLFIITGSSVSRCKSPSEDAHTLAEQACVYSSIHWLVVCALCLGIAVSLPSLLVMHISLLPPPLPPGCPAGVLRGLRAAAGL